MILNQELNKLKLICSNDLLLKINELKVFNDKSIADVQRLLNNISLINDINITITELNNWENNTNYQVIAILWQDMEVLMRKEISYNKY
jgi:hypothetical protein